MFGSNTKQDLEAPVAPVEPTKPPSEPWNSSWSCEPEGLCGCTTDMCTCCATTWCSYITIPQLYERVIGPAGRCMQLYFLLFFLVVLHLVLLTIPATREVSELMIIAIDIILVVLLCMVRQRVRRDEKLEQQTCTCVEGAEDCCCAWWCGPCTACLLLRHLGLGGGKYSMTSATGSIDSVEAAPLAGAKV